MSKPAHRGRILVSSRLPGIENVGNSQQRTAQPPVKSTGMAPRRGSGSKSADVGNGSIMAAGTSALGGLSKDKLQRRVGELEFENQKLKNNLEKAELSVESYRSFLSAKSASRSHSTAVQTDFLTESHSASKITPNKKSQITRLTNKLEDAKNKILLLTEEISQFEERDRVSKVDLAAVKDEYSTLKMKTDLSEVSYKAQIQTLEKDLRALQAKNQQLDSLQSPTVRTPKQQQHQQHFKTPPSKQASECTNSKPFSLKKNGGIDKMTAVSSAQKLEMLSPHSPPSSFDRLTSRPSAEMIISPLGLGHAAMKKSKLLSSAKKPLPVTPSVDRGKQHKSSQKAFRKKFASNKTHFTTIRNAISQDFDDFSNFFTLSSHKIIGEIQKVERCREASTAEHLKVISDLNLKLDEAEVLKSKSASQADSQAAMLEQLTVAKNAVETERDRADSLEMLLESKLNDKNADISNLTTLFNSVSKELKNLQSKCKAEAAAVKHMGHCKDLVRVATIRELNLDKDRAYSELKYARYVSLEHKKMCVRYGLPMCKLRPLWFERIVLISIFCFPHRDIQSVLGFCLETAEKALNETQPQIVERLHESRRKRTTLLEREVMLRRKDLDQRSAETCAVSSTHLEAFQEKSAVKHKKATEEAEALFLEIQNILNIKSSI
jgi:hypothetical protein